MSWTQFDDSGASFWLIILASASLLYVSIRSRFVTGVLPPGPPSGYLGKGRFDMPAEPYKRFVELAKAYGEHFIAVSRRLLCFTRRY